LRPFSRFLAKPRFFAPAGRAQQRTEQDRDRVMPITLHRLASITYYGQWPGVFSKK